MNERRVSVENPPVRLLVSRRPSVDRCADVACRNKPRQPTPVHLLHEDFTEVTVVTQVIDGIGSARVIGFSMTTDARLGELMHKAAAKAGMKHLAWVRSIMVDAVNAAGFEYVPETKESLKDELARMKAELAAAQALLAKDSAPLTDFEAALKAPTAPNQIADAKTGKLVAA